MKQLLLSFFLICVPILANAERVNVNIDGIYYLIINESSDKYAIVINGDEEYTGDIVIPENVTYNNNVFGVYQIRSNSFSHCKQLISVTINANILDLEDETFKQCEKLVSVILPNTIEHIGKYAFLECISLKSIIIPDNVKTIGEGAFQGCSNLELLKLSVGLEKIGQSAFYGCTKIQSLEIYENLKVIEYNNAFSGCHFKTIIVDERNPIYDSRENCNALIETSSNKLLVGSDNTVIPNSILSIGKGAFNGCSIISIIIPQSVVNIEEYSMSGCNNLESITVEESNPIYDSRDNCNAVVETQTNTIISACKNTTISSSIENIGNYAFSGLKISTISIPDNITNIGSSAFSGCDNLSSVLFGKGLKEIGSSAFGWCRAIEEIDLPEGIIEIGRSCFAECTSLKLVKIPSTIEYIGSSAFESCNSLCDFYIYSERLPNLSETAGKYSNPFWNLNLENATLHVPSKSIDIYKANEYWGRFGSIVGIESFYTLSYIVDGELYKIFNIEEGTNIIPEPAPTKEGYTFSGWSEIPQTMPAEDVTVTGTFTINQYKLTYMIDDKVYKEVEYDYGATIVPEQRPDDEEYISFEWVGLPETMPAHDVTVYASYETGIRDVLMQQNVLRIYNSNGIVTDRPQKGLNIIQMSDGSTRKVLVK